MIRLFCFIISAVIGSGIFIAPYAMSQYGLMSLIGFIVIALIFTHMINIFTSIKDIPSFLNQYLGRKIGVLMSLLYWLFSWTSTLVVINEMIIYLVALFPLLVNLKLLLQIGSLIFFVVINLFGVKRSSTMEICITTLKIIPLILFPIIFLIYRPLPTTNVIYTVGNHISLLKSIPAVIFCFLGIECVNIINNQLKLSATKLKIAALSAMGTISLIYLSNISIIFYLLGTNFPSPRPYIDIMLYYLGPLGGVIFSIVVFIICFGTSNTWVISSGVMAQDLAKEKVLPIYFAKDNNFGSPGRAIILSSIGLIPMFILLQHQSLAQSMLKLLDISCIGLMLFYGSIALSNFRKNKSIISIICTIFFICCFLFLSYIEIKSLF